MNVIALSLICMFFYGIFDYMIAKPARHIKTLQLILIFSAMNSLFLLFLAIFLQSKSFDASFHILYPMCAGIIGHLGVFLYSKSLVNWKIGISSSVANAYPLITVFIGYLFLKEAFLFSQWVFFIFVLIGIMFSSFHIDEIKSFRFQKQKESIFLAFGAMICWALFTFFFDRAVEYYDAATAGFIAECTIVFWVGIYFLLSWRKEFSQLTNIKKDMYLRIFQISCIGITWFLAIWYAFQIWSLALVSAIAACSPAVTTLLARVFWSEKLEIVQYIAIWVLVFGISGLSYVSV